MARDYSLTTVRAPVAAAVDFGALGLRATALIFLVCAMVSAMIAQDPRLAAPIGEHLAMCLSGQTNADGAGRAAWALWGHCAACYATVGLSALGAAALIMDRVRTAR